MWAEALTIARRSVEPGGRAHGPEGLEDDRQGSSATREAVRAALTTAEDHIALARTVGADPVEAESLLAEARRAAEREDYPAARGLAKRARVRASERRRQGIQTGMDLQDTQIE